MRTKKGRDLIPGDVVHGARVVAVRPYLIPARILHAYYAEKFPDGMPGYLVDTAPTHLGFTAFADEDYPVT